MIKTLFFESTDELGRETLGLLRATLATPGNLMLSGGATPYALYNRLAAAPCPVHPQRRLFLSDERMAPYDSARNNAHNLMPMLKALACEDRFIRVDTSLPAKEAANRFAGALESMGSIDLGFLGMGNDGHTAGLFTLEHAAAKTGPLTLHTGRPDGIEGVSVTPALLQRVQRIILLVAGESKRAIIDALRSAPRTLPAGTALEGHPHIELWTDVRVS